VCLLVLAPEELPSRPRPKCCFLLAPNKLSVACQRSLAPASAAGRGRCRQTAALGGAGDGERRYAVALGSKQTTNVVSTALGRPSERQGIKPWAVTPPGSKTSGAGSQ
jgi:hypothetical protein